jgi:hypothetical protein
MLKPGLFYSCVHISHMCSKSPGKSRPSLSSGGSTSLQRHAIHMLTNYSGFSARPHNPMQSYEHMPSAPEHVTAATEPPLQRCRLTDLDLQSPCCVVDAQIGSRAGPRSCGSRAGRADMSPGNNNTLMSLFPPRFTALVYRTFDVRHSVLTAC